MILRLMIDVDGILMALVLMRFVDCLLVEYDSLIEGVHLNGMHGSER